MLHSGWKSTCWCHPETGQVRWKDEVEEQEINTNTADALLTFLCQVWLPHNRGTFITKFQALSWQKQLVECSREKCCLPEHANDRPVVSASVDLELVGVCILKMHAVSQPEHIGGILFLGPCAFQGALHFNRFAQRRDDSLGTPLKPQIFD